MMNNFSFVSKFCEELFVRHTYYNNIGTKLNHVKKVSHIRV